VGLIDLIAVTTAALLVFRIPFRGSALLLLGSAILFLLTSLGAGLFLSTISQRLQQAMMSSFFFAVPAFMLSGFGFPIPTCPGGAVADVFEPAALLHGGRARDFPQRHGHRRAMAADSVAGRLRSAGDGVQRAAVP
jgi:ABC-type polysaccharide/polyol phosphate export permease